MNKKTILKANVGINITNPVFYLYLVGIIVVELLIVYVLHQIPVAGKTILPIYLFVLLGFINLGLPMAIALSILIPLTSYLVSGMPPVAFMPAIITKGYLLSLSLQLYRRWLKNPYIGLVLAIISYQAISTILMLLIGMPHIIALNDIVVGYPGLILQVVLGSINILLIKKHLEKEKA